MHVSAGQSSLHELLIIMLEMGLQMYMFWGLNNLQSASHHDALDRNLVWMFYEMTYQNHKIE